MIVSTGIDIIDIRRIKETIDKYNYRFKQKCFHPSEINKSESRLKSVESYAKRYAAKEACAKALGTGFRNGLNFKDVEILNDNLGKPYLKLNNKTKKIISKTLKVKNFDLFLSISDEKEYSIAFTIIQTKNV